MSEKMFPLQSQRDCPPGPRQIPWSIAEKAHGEYANRYGGNCQSLERLAERGGFGWGEMDGLYPAWREEVDEIRILKNALEVALARIEDSGNGNYTIEQWVELCRIGKINREDPWFNL